ncbi:DUF3040 domain-containing protein [Streptomyces sp. NPDC003832]
MPDSDDEKIAALEAVLWHDDPRFARSLGKGRPRQPREYRHGRAWTALAAGLAVALVGAVLSRGVLLAAGLLMTAMTIGVAGPTAGRRSRRPRS